MQPLRNSGDRHLVHIWWLVAAVLVSVKVIMGWLSDDAALQAAAVVNTGLVYSIDYNKIIHIDSNRVTLSIENEFIRLHI